MHEFVHVALAHDHPWQIAWPDGDLRSAPAAPAPSGDKLHTELSLVDAAAFSVGLIGPVGAIGLLGTGAALIIGRAVTLSFVFAVIGVALVAYCFVKLSQHISHTGSVYALVGVTLGPRAGFFAGWALMGAYTAIGCGSTIEIGLFGQQFINNTFHAHISQWWWLALIGLAGCWRSASTRSGSSPARC